MCINVAEKVEIDIFLDEPYLHNRNFLHRKFLIDLSDNITLENYIPDGTKRNNKKA